MASDARPAVTYTRLGNSGLKVSNPILGAMSFGNPNWAGPWVLGEDKALPILKAAYDNGINSWDTANVYGYGDSERIIAKAIKHYKIPRERLVIMTKCNGTVGDPGTSMADMLKIPNIGYTKEYVNQQGLSRKAIFSAVDASLKRLETDYIDLLQIHRCDSNTPFEETMEALHDLVKSGKVRYIGASSMWTWQFSEYQHIAAINKWTKFISMQNHYSLLYREEEREMIPYCKATGVGLIPWSPLARGHLARPAGTGGKSVRGGIEEDRSKSASPGLYMIGSTETDAKIIGRVEEIAKKRGWSMAAVALAWINGKVTAPIIGMGNVERVLEGLEAGSKLLDEEEVKYLEELYEPLSVMGHT
ncbi:NADP-dependent oxidoreductase domain-containing protein [Morchella snyderi]|nr:NADP-dependent oxidoreductase domain-containing protein [Morchella snyderi]